MSGGRFYDVFLPSKKENGLAARTWGGGGGR